MMRLLAWVLLAAAAVPALAQEFGRLEMVVPGGPGSGQDQAARAYEQAMRAERLISGAQIIHVAGGGGMSAVSQFLTGKAGNGNAVVTQGAGHLSFPLSNKTPVSLNDVVPLARLGGEYELLVVRTESEFKTIDDLIAKYKANPGSIVWAAGARGSTDHIFYALISKAAGIDPKRLNYLPHANTGDIVAAVLGGHAHVGAGGYQDFVTAGPGRPHARAGGRLGGAAAGNRRADAARKRSRRGGDELARRFGPSVAERRAARPALRAVREDGEEPELAEDAGRERAGTTCISTARAMRRS